MNNLDVTLRRIGRYSSNLEYELRGNRTLSLKDAEDLLDAFESSRDLKPYQRNRMAGFLATGLRHGTIPRRALVDSARAMQGFYRRYNGGDFQGYATFDIDIEAGLESKHKSINHENLAESAKLLLDLHEASQEARLVSNFNRHLRHSLKHEFGPTSLHHVAPLMLEAMKPGHEPWYTLHEISDGMENGKLSHKDIEIAAPILLEAAKAGRDPKRYIPMFQGVSTLKSAITTDEAETIMRYAKEYGEKQVVELVLAAMKAKEHLRIPMRKVMGYQRKFLANDHFPTCDLMIKYHNSRRPRWLKWLKRQGRKR